MHRYWFLKRRNILFEICIWFCYQKSFGVGLYLSPMNAWEIASLITTCWFFAFKDCSIRFSVPSILLSVLSTSFSFIKATVTTSAPFLFRLFFFLSCHALYHAEHIAFLEIVHFWDCFFQFFNNLFFFFTQLNSLPFLYFVHS